MQDWHACVPVLQSLRLHPPVETTYIHVQAVWLPHLQCLAVKPLAMPCVMAAATPASQYYFGDDWCKCCWTLKDGLKKHFLEIGNSHTVLSLIFDIDRQHAHSNMRPALRMAARLYHLRNSINWTLPSQ